MTFLLTNLLSSHYRTGHRGKAETLTPVVLCSQLLDLYMSTEGRITPTMYLSRRHHGWQQDIRDNGRARLGPIIL
jgi:hypothetical protein